MQVIYKKISIKRGMLFFSLLFLSLCIQAQQVNLSIEVGTSPNAGKKLVTVKYNAVGGNFEGSNGTDEWNAQTITLGWLPGTGMTVSAPGINADITSCTAPSSFSFVDNFTSSASVISYTLDLLGGTADGNIYTTFVVNGSTSNQAILDGSSLTVLTFDIPDTWTSGSVFLLETQPAGPAIGLAPVINNSVLGQVWDGGSASASLPIELTFFRAKANPKRQVLLDWETSSEKNNDYFTVERSADGRNFKDIAEVSGAGTSNEILSYQTLDKHPLRGTNYYRLKQTDFDGASTWSEIQTVTFDTFDDIRLVVYPNPTSAGFTLDPVFEEFTVELFNVSGQRLLSEQNIREVDTSILPAGTYFLKVKDLETQLYKSVNVQIIH